MGKLWEGDVNWTYDGLGKECIGVGNFKAWDSWYVKYFNTITLSDGTDNVACAAMTAGGLSSAMVEKGDGADAMRVHVYRSPCRKSKAYHFAFADNRASWSLTFFKKGNCKGNAMGAPWSITDGSKQSWHNRYFSKKQKSFAVDGECFNDKSMGWKKSKATYYAKNEGLDLEFCQDNIFVPTKY